MTTPSFEFQARTRLVFGANAIERLGALARELGARRVFLVTDAGVRVAGHVDRASAALDAAGLETRIWDGVRENPTTVDVERARAALGDWPLDLFVGLGGGSSLDVAKGVNFLRAGGGTMADYRGRGTAKGTLLPMIAVPTTAGTGSETQSFALIGEEESHQKMACGDPQAAPRIALLDPTLTVTLPRLVTVYTGLDTIGHAVEAAVTRPRSPASVLFATEAFRLAEAWLPRVLAAPDDVEARGRMLLAAAYAGIAIENGMLGAAHAMANPLTARCGLAHGLAVGLALPVVVAFNAEDAEAAAGYAGLMRAARPATADGAAAPRLLEERLRELLSICGVDPRLGAHGVAASGLEGLADEAALQWTGGFNPRPCSAGDFRDLYHRAHGGR